jgi:hypothetical protein
MRAHGGCGCGGPLNGALRLARTKCSLKPDAKTSRCQFAKVFR